MKNKSMLCVGGVRAGQRYAVANGNGFRVPVAQSMPLAADGIDRASDEACTVEFHDYRAELFRTPQGDVEFWVPAGQTPLETITMLLESYEQKLCKRPVAFAVHTPNGPALFRSEESAAHAALAAGVDYDGLYIRR